MAFPAILGSSTDELIEAIIGTTPQTDPTHFGVLRETSLRKLRQHNFLRTNQFEVYSSLDGYEERFRVLNRDGIADALRDRLDALAQCSTKWTPDVLHLLLELADQPVQKSRLDDLESVKIANHKTEPVLRWSDIAKEEGWDGGDELWQNVDFTGHNSDDGYANYESDTSTKSEDTSLSSIESRYRKQPTDYIERVQNQSELDEIFKSQLWRPRKSAGDLNGGPHNVIITETQAIREVLFMLGGFNNDLFDQQEKPLLNAQLTHASEQIFRSLLVSANNIGRRLSTLRRYVQQRQDIPLLQVFKAAIEDRLRSFDSTVAGMQAQYAPSSQGSVASIMRLFSDLDPYILPLKSLSGIIDQLERTKSTQPFHYLELLYDSAQSLQLGGDESTYHFISQLFFECFAVYLRPIRRWMQNGELLESDKTFFISRSPVDVPWSQTWAHQFKLKRTSQGSLFAPRFLQPAASKIFTTGKSIVILKLLKKHWLAHEEVPETTTQIDMRAISSLIPFSEIFKNMFDEWMQSKHHAASATLKQTLFQTYNLWSELGVLHRIYLMSDGACSDKFANAIFRNIDALNVYWHDRFNLTEIAREAYDQFIELHRLNASISWGGSACDVKDVRRSVREGLSSIHITYQLPWLPRIVLSDESLDHYQQVFTFLLQLRRANYVLTRHRILSDGLAYGTAEQEKFYGLRSKLLWFCNALQSYLSTLVIGPLVGKLSEEMEQAEDIDQMIISHSVFTKRMIDETCLGGKLDPIRQAVLDIFDLAIRLQDARQVEIQRAAEEEQELSRLSFMSSPRNSRANRYMKTIEEEDERSFDDLDRSAIVPDATLPYGQELSEIRFDLDRHLKFICGGLRGVARASGSGAASKWDILAEMLEVGIRGVR